MSDSTEEKEAFSDTYKSDFINKLRLWRNKKNISAREMSIALGQNVNYINLIENGKRLPSLAGFFSICDYLKITPEDFFGSRIVLSNFSENEIIDLFSTLSPNQINCVVSMIQEFKK